MHTAQYMHTLRDYYVVCPLVYGVSNSAAEPTFRALPSQRPAKMTILQCTVRI